jgi:hypothetical protein
MADRTIFTAEAAPPHHGGSTGLEDLDVTQLVTTFPARIALVSPPRVGSTPVARLLWEHPAVSHHCHEPFEARYWGTGGAGSVRRCLLNPMDVATGERERVADVGGARGLLVKEMSFQLDHIAFQWLCALTDRPVVFVVREPRAAAVSRLRIVRELSGASTFPPPESGWPALAEQVGICVGEGIPYVVVDSGDLRADPAGVCAALLSALGLPFAPDLASWRPRPGLRLCAPDVGALMGEVRARDDPFYRRVLASHGVEPPDRRDREAEQALLDEAGLGADVARWEETYRRLRADPHLIRAAAPEGSGP